MNRSSTVPARARRALWGGLLLWTAGCTAEPAQFKLNREGGSLRDLKPEQIQFLSTATWAMFGGPDDPHALPETGLNADKLRLAAGPVWSDELGKKRGLYRLHCVHCHGVTGDGAGPTAAFLKPYPRDYRQGKFKFKSTGTNDKPTDGDLERILRDGIPGTAMPSFALLPQDELDALVEYVKYLSIRGETETLLLAKIQEEDQFSLPWSDLVGEDVLALVMGRWSEAGEKVITPPDRPNVKLEDSIALGAKLFQDGKRTQCAKCHGPTGLGDGGQELYDEWNKDKKPKSESLKQPIEDLFALPLQRIEPRNLRLGIYRGGRRPVDIYRRMHAGISVSGMPNFNLALKPEEIWALVDYVQSMPHEAGYAPPREREGAHKLRQ